MRKKGLFLLTLFAFVSAFSQNDFNYGEALQKSLLFYETQQSGVLPDWNRISWRSNSGVNDGKDVGLDLTGGWNDAGDHIKFGFPMAFSVTALNWGYLQYKDGYDAVNQTEIFKRNIKWVTDYFIKCHPSPNVFYAQVADSKSQDHNFWMPAEMVDVHPDYGQRQAYALTKSKPGTDVACETAAALASASMVFKDSDPAYSATLLQHAKELYEFGDSFRGLYTDKDNGGAIPADGTYTSTNFRDELAWGALWLYQATGEQKYLDKAEAEYFEPDYVWSLVWEDKSYGNMVLLSMLTGKQNYIQNAERHLDFWQKGGGINYSPGGQAHLTQWGSSRHAMNASLTALIFSDNVNSSKSKQYHDFAVQQINYVLGDNPMNRSLVTGFGVNPPTRPHHRGMHSSWTRKETIPDISRHTLIGALLGGPLKPDDTLIEDRTDFLANEVATDYNACYTGVLARMVMEFGGSELPNFPQPETPGVEFLNEVKINAESARFTEVAIWLNNRSGWPARVPNSLSARYYVDISEGIEAGLKPSDYVITSRGAGSHTGGLQEWNAASNIYFVEVAVDADKMPFPGGQGEHRAEIQLRVSIPNSAPASSWDASNDPSYEGLSGTVTEATSLPIYSDNKLAYGDEPSGSEVLSAGFTVSSTTGVIPFDVTVDASRSNDPTGEGLTYQWSFGNNDSANTQTASTIYNEEGSYTITLTVTDTTGATASKTATVEAIGERDCNFNTPSSTSLPTMDNTTFSKVHIIGENGPDLSNVTSTAFNWNNENNGLYAFAFNTSNGVPDYYYSLLPFTNQNLSSENPDIEITNSGIENLDGSYWATTVEGDLALVSKTKELTLYFSNDAEPPVCNSGSPELSIFDVVAQDLNISIYPNPVSENLHINAKDNNLNITVFDLKGIEVKKSSNVDANSILNVSNLADGIYLLQIETPKGAIQVEKIVVQHN